MTRDAWFALPPASQLIAGCVPHNLHLLWTHPPHAQYRHHLLKSPLLVRTDGHEDDGSFLMACGVCLALGFRKPTRFCLQSQHRASANPTFGPAGRLFPSSVQVRPVVVPSSSAMLVVSQWD